jgi:hypothetical protein
MPSDLDPDVSFIDSLSESIDDIRRSIHGSLGTRTYRVQIVQRQWSGDRIGEGTPSVTILELEPRPLVRNTPNDRMGPGGREETGDVILTEVSLKYSALDLQPKALPTLEVAYRIIDDGGQGQPDQWFVLQGDPVSRRGDRRGDNCDWRIHLHQTAPMSNFDGAEP